MTIDMSDVKSVFVVPVYSKPDGSVRVLLSEEDMKTKPARANPPQTAQFEPALDALGGKRDGGAIIETVLRELFEETGGLIPDKILRRLGAWIAALPQGSPNFYYSGAGAGGSALFFFYPVQRDEMSFWFKLHENFESEFGQAPFDRTRKRSPSHLHWVDLVAPPTATRGMPVKAPQHRCVPDGPGCAARCGCIKCPFESRDSKTLEVKPHVAQALQHLQHLRPALLLPQPQQSLPQPQLPLSLSQPPPAAGEPQITRVTARSRAAAAAMLGSGREGAVPPPAGARRAAAPLRRQPPTPPLQRPQDVDEMDEPEHTIPPPAAASLEATPLAAAPPAAAPAAVASPELTGLAQQVRDQGLSQVLEVYQSVAGPLWSTPQRPASVPYDPSPRTLRYGLSAPPARRAAAFDDPAPTVALPNPPVLAPLPTRQPVSAAAAAAAAATAATTAELPEATEVEAVRLAAEAAAEANAAEEARLAAEVEAIRKAARKARKARKATKEKLRAAKAQQEADAEAEQETVVATAATAAAVAAAAAVTPTAAAAPMAMDLNDEPAPAPMAAPVLVRVPAPVPAAEQQEQTGRDSDDGAVTEAWNGPEPAEVPAEGPSLQKKPRGRPPHGTNGLPMRWDGPKEAGRWVNDEEPATRDSGGVEAVAPALSVGVEPPEAEVHFASPLNSRRRTAATGLAGQAWYENDAEVLERIKERERDVYVAAGGEAGALEQEHAESDLEDGAERESDEDDYPARGSSAPKRKRTQAKGERRTDDGRNKRPCGRSPRAKVWDDRRGCWVAAEAETGAPSSLPPPTSLKLATALTGPPPEVADVETETMSSGAAGDGSSRDCAIDLCSDSE